MHGYGHRGDVGFMSAKVFVDMWESGEFAPYSFHVF